MSAAKLNSLTVIIPAYNEARALAAVVNNVVLGLRPVSDYEILIINDASTDNTGAIADHLASQNQRIRVIHNPRNMNLGFNFRKGLELARMQFVCLIPGDDEVSQESIAAIIGATGAADLVLAYHANSEMRHPLRRLISRTFVRILNFLFGLNIRYYNGPAIFDVAAARTVSLTTFGFAYMAEMAVTLLKRGHSYKEIPMTIKQNEKGINWRVFRPKNVLGVMKTLFSLWWRAKRGKL